MQKQDYQTSFTATASPKEAYEKILNVSAWWSKHSEGMGQKPGDVFTVRFGPNGEKDMYKIEVVEATPGARIVWKVLDSKQDWVKKTTEWTGTKIIWDISAEQGETKITLTHQGLNQELECYKTCVGGWDWLTGESLSKLIQENMGKPV